MYATLWTEYVPPCLSGGALLLNGAAVLLGQRLLERQNEKSRASAEAQRKSLNASALGSLISAYTVLRDAHLKEGRGAVKRLERKRRNAIRKLERLVTPDEEQEPPIQKEGATPPA